MIEPGTKAPDFTLRDQDGNEVASGTSRAASWCSPSIRSTSARSAPTSSASTRRCSASSSSEGATLVGISVDSAYCHAAFAKQLNLTMPLLADFNPKGEVSRAYGAWIEAADHGNRSLVLVGRGRGRRLVARGADAA